jgi:hypothetical protein
MDELVKSVVLYLEFMVLGAAAVLIAGAPFVDRFVTAWRSLVDAAIRIEENASSSWVRRSLECAFFMGTLFLIGVAVNSATYWILQPAHIHVIHAVGAHSRDPKARPPIHPDRMFFLRPLPTHWTLEEVYYDVYAEDSKRQMQWMKENKASNDSSLDSTEKQIRLIRGLVLATPVLGILGVLSAVWTAIREKQWERGVGRGITYAFVAVVLYLFLMTSYWSLEVYFHRMVWNWPGQAIGKTSPSGSTPGSSEPATGPKSGGVDGQP